MNGIQGLESLIDDSIPLVLVYYLGKICLSGDLCAAKLETLELVNSFLDERAGLFHCR